MAKRAKKFYRRYSPRSRIRRFRKGNAPIPLLPTLALANGALLQPLFGNDPHGIYGAYAHFNNGNFDLAAKEFVDVIGINFLGTKFSDGTRNPHWNAMMINNYTAIGAGVLAHYIANKVGLNRVMRKAPFIGKYVSL